jgi:uncharacterized membrane protein YdbT with pleckstrin-like domain
MDIIRRSPAGLTLRIIIIEITLQVSYLILSTVLIGANEQLGSMYALVRISITLLFLALGIFSVVFLVSQWANEGYFLKENELTVRRGIIGKNDTSYPYANMQSVSVQQFLIGRIFNYGQVTIYIPTLGKEIVFSEISDPHAFANTLKSHIPYPENGQFILRR